MTGKRLFRLGVILSVILALSMAVVMARADGLRVSGPAAPLATVFSFLPLVRVDSRPAEPPSPTPEATHTTPPPTKTPPPGPESKLVADHRVIAQFDEIPASAITDAAATDTLFMHQSTGNNIEYLGLRCLAGIQDGLEDPEGAECAGYTDGVYDYSLWEWPVWDPPLADAHAKTDLWVDVVEARQSEFTVLGMKFCYVDGWNQDFEYYRQRMEALEAAYPQKIFIWSTSALWTADGGASQVSLDAIQEFNRKAREYALKNGKYLYDIAAIESHLPSGEPCTSNGYEVLCAEYNDGLGGGGGGHPDVLGSIRLAKGFWWLMARISGWEG